MGQYFSLLDQSEEDEIQQLLLSIADHQNGMDFVEAHGYLTAMVINPRFETTHLDEAYQRAILEAICASPGETLALSDLHRSKLTRFIVKAQSSIARAFYRDEIIPLPCELLLDEPVDSSPLRGWSLGFMDGVFADEEIWFSGQSDEIESLLLPIAVAAGEQVELPAGHPLTTPKGLGISLNNIPTTLTEIYFLFRQTQS